MATAANRWAVAAVLGVLVPADTTCHRRPATNPDLATHHSLHFRQSFRHLNFEAAPVKTLANCDLRQRKLVATRIDPACGSAGSIQSEWQPCARRAGSHLVVTQKLQKIQPCCKLWGVACVLGVEG